VPTSLSLSVLLTQVISFNFGITVNILAGSYSTHFRRDNLEAGRGHLLADAHRAHHRDPGAGQLQPRRAGNPGKPHRRQPGGDVGDDGDFTHIFIDTANSANDTAQVTGVIRKNGTSVATISGR